MNQSPFVSGDPGKMADPCFFWSALSLSLSLSLSLLGYVFFSSVGWSFPEIIGRLDVGVFCVGMFNFVSERAAKRN